MADDRDLAPLLSEAPIPRPIARRDGLEAALRRFDGRPEPSPASIEQRPTRRLWNGWPQLSALATALVAIIVTASVWRSVDPNVPAPPAQEVAKTQARGSPPARMAAEGTADEAQAFEAANRPADDALRAPATKPETSTGSESRAAAPQLSAAADATDKAAAPAQTSFAPAPPPPPAAAPTQPEMEGGAAVADEGNIVVTGSLVSRSTAGRYAGPGPRARRASARGDWTACTIDDPDQDLAACRERLGRGGGAAAGLVLDGLARAWSGDNPGAVRAFSAAIREDRRMAVAYVNRGLILASEGKLRRGLADLTRAVTVAPRGAQAYYHRSILLERLGDPADARADAQKAVRLDPSYREVVR